MKLKKNPSKDIERNKALFLAIGLSLGLLGVWAVFSTSQEINATATLGNYDIETVVLDIPQVTREKTPEQQMAPPPPPKPISDKIEIVKDIPEIDEGAIPEDEPNVKDAIEGMGQSGAAIVGIVDTTEVLDGVIEVMPEFPGGERALAAWLSKTVKYPTDAQREGVEGRVTVEFVVWNDGTVKDATILRGVHPSLDNEALRVMSKMPNWQPGMQGGRAVNCKFRLPITFKLQR
ncbi:MAG: energy transducer TonB [Bacteroidales bacterium]